MGRTEVNDKRGFTLIEVLMASFIMVLVLSALVYGLSQSLQLTQTVRDQDIAINAAQEKLEEIANNTQTITGYNNQVFSVAGLTPDPAGSVSVTQVAATNLYDVTITVGWQQTSGRQISRTVNATLLQR
jgi:prepilin-type N-terminal cleavage/methylation domain-containing protein